MEKFKTIFFKIGALFLLLGVSYLRHTWYIDPFFEHDRLLIPIPEGKQFAGNLSFRSMLTFFALFGGVFWCFGTIFFRRKRLLMIRLFVILAAVSAMFYGLYVFSEADVFFRAGSIIKNALLSPVFALVAYLWTHKTRKP